MEMQHGEEQRLVESSASNKKETDYASPIQTNFEKAIQSHRHARIDAD